MARHQGTVLVDTNVIIECHRVRSWTALAGGYSVETVEDCVSETPTGFQQRRPEQQIDTIELRKSMTKVHCVADRMRAELSLLVSDIALDRGERSLWAHAIHREDAWLLCGPDTAGLRAGIRFGFRERLVSLESLLDDVGHRPRSTLRHAYTRNWHRRTVSRLILIEAGRS